MSDFDIVIKLDPGQPVAGAKAVTAAVAGVETQSKKAAEAMDNVASAAKSLKSIDFKQAAAAGAAAWGILSQKLDIANTAIGQAIDSSVKFGAIGAQIAGPWGAALGAIGGAVLVLTDNITGLNSKITTLAEESKKIAADAIKNMGGRLGELAREAKKTAEDLQKMNNGLFALPGALAATFDAFDKQRDIVKRAREEIEKYNAAQFAASPQGNLTKGLVSGVFGRSFDKPKTGGGERTYNNGVSPLSVYDGSTRNPYMGLGESAGTDALEQLDLAKLAQDSLNEKIAKNAEETLKLAENTRKWNEELIATNVTAQVVSNALTQAASSFADTLVDAANGADVSWREWGANMLVMFEKMIAQALILKAIGSASGGIGGGGSGLLGLLFGGGHATGGSYTAPATGGGPDSIPVMFRMSPRETATFTPQGQVFGGGGGGSGPVNLRVVNQADHDPRSLAQALDNAHGERLVLNVLRRNRGALKTLMP